MKKVHKIKKPSVTEADRVPTSKVEALETSASSSPTNTALPNAFSQPSTSKVDIKIETSQDSNISYY